jgi:hypothetical protein
MTDLVDPEDCPLCQAKDVLDNTYWNTGHKSFFLSKPDEKDLREMTEEEFENSMNELIQCKADLHEKRNEDAT